MFPITPKINGVIGLVSSCQNFCEDICHRFSSTQHMLLLNVSSMYPGSEYRRGSSVSSLLMSECSFDIGFIRASTNVRLTREKTGGKSNYILSE